jgi:hypothetical protein
VSDDSPGDGGAVRAFSLVITGFACCADSPAGYEADAAPRGAGNGRVTATDWVQIGRFIAGLESPASGAEFQRADCAPRATRGDGRIDLEDWAQAGRYASGADALLPAGGPNAPVAAREAARTGAPPLRLALQTEARGAGAVVRIPLDSRAGAASFSLQFDPAQWRFASAESPDGVTRLTNAQHAAQGRLGFVLSWEDRRRRPPNELRVRFTPISARRGRTPVVSFADWPVAHQVNHRVSSVIRMPCRGRSVTSGCISTR